MYVEQALTRNTNSNDSLLINLVLSHQLNYRLNLHTVYHQSKLYFLITSLANYYDSISELLS
jgi:hypothetical protein